MTSLRSCRGIVLLIAVSALGLASAAGPSGSVVRVTAVVTNARGEPVAGLRASDFRITVDGTPQAVGHGIEFKTGTPNTPRAFGLVLDEFHVDASDSTAVREALAPSSTRCSLETSRPSSSRSIRWAASGRSATYRCCAAPSPALKAARATTQRGPCSSRSPWLRRPTPSSEHGRRSSRLDCALWRRSSANWRASAPRLCWSATAFRVSAQIEPSRQACSQPSESRTAATCPFTCSRQGKSPPIGQRPSRPGRCSREWPCRREENSSAGSRRLATA